MHGRIRIVAALVLIAILALAAVGIFRAVTRVARNVDFDAGEPDPMFAAPAEIVTRPPELDAEIPQAEHPTLDDYVPAVESPVDKTAAELIGEAKSQN